MSPLRWTTQVDPQRWRPSWPARGTRSLRRHWSATCCASEGYSLQGNAKTVEGKQHPDRDAQFRYINEQVREYRRPGSR